MDILKGRFSAFLGAGLLAVGLVAGVQAQAGTEEPESVPQQDTTTLRDGIRPFNRICAGRDWRNGRIVLLAEFLPSAIDRSTRLSLNGPLLVDIHPHGMKTYMDEATMNGGEKNVDGEVKYVEGILERLQKAGNKTPHMAAVEAEFQKAAEGFAASEGRQMPECADFLDEMAGAGKFQEICVQDGVTAALFSHPLTGTKFVRFQDTERFIKESYGKPEFAQARAEFEKAREAHWDTVTDYHMRGRSMPRCSQ